MSDLIRKQCRQLQPAGVVITGRWTMMTSLQGQLGDWQL